jgi:hypothetical protein
VTDTCFENKNKDLLGSMEHETLDLECIRVVKDYLKQQATMNENAKMRKNAHTFTT